MKLFVTGTEGYIGSRLVPLLLADGHEVTGLDTGFYRDGWLFSEQATYTASARQLNKDLRKVTAQDLEGYDGVVHLAELSNDPLGQNNPQVTFEINHQGSVRLAQLAKQAGVKRFVYASSCSVYGQAATEWVDETSPVNPQTAYAHCKANVERDVTPLANKDFTVTFLRNATAYGASPRIRFDIVLNDLCALAWTRKLIAMTSDGTPWRPIVHIEDICRAIRCTLVAPSDVVNAQVFNVGADSENYRIRELAEIVAAVFEGCQVTIGSSAGDNRSYRVSFKKITAGLPGFRCEWTAKRGAEQLRDLFQRIEMSPDTYQFRAFTRLKQLNYLQSTGQVDEKLYWRY
ncbi:MAG: SDR family oxidoreductase [Pseudomonadales bacterium]|nr:SDR family oxidoreductase [Pseudomonadales bacterium]